MWQSQRLREYRRAFSGWTLFWKWLVIAYLGATLLSLVMYPPINTPDDPIPLGPADYMMMGMGLLAATAYAVSVGTGRDLVGRTPRQLLLRQRLGRYNRRKRKFQRIERERARRAHDDPNLRLHGSTLGFETQVDEFGPWMRDGDLRGLIRSSGYVGADIAYEYKRRLAERGVRIPEWVER